MVTSLGTGAIPKSCFSECGQGKEFSLAEGHLRVGEQVISVCVVSARVSGV